MLFTLILIILRLSLRRRRPSHTLAANLSDIFVVASWLSGIVLISINTWKNNLRHKYQHLPQEGLYYGVPKDQAAHLLYVSWISLFFIYISLWLSKAAFIAFYYDFFTYQSRQLRIMLWSTSVITAFTFLLHMLLLFLWCHPISLNWYVTSNSSSISRCSKTDTLSTGIFPPTSVPPSTA